ncbi:MAG: Tol-Pal system beta propeller repeat protein TolB [Thiohalomonadaceae bacterium]
MRKILRLLLTAAFLATGTTHAVLNVEITEGMEGALPIAVVPFGWSGPAPLPQDIADVVRSDLARSGRFAPLAVDRLPARPTEARAVDYAAWRATGAESLVIGRVRARDGGGYVVEFQLLDVPRGQQLVGYSIPSSASQLRRVAHQISDIVYEKLTGERGAFDTNISYVTEERSADGKRTYRLAVADSDAYNEQIVLTSTQPIMSPAWSPDGRRLAYVSFEQGHSAVYVQEVATGKREKVADHPGINSAPAFSPDGRFLALTLSRDGNPEIYVLEFAGKRLTRITSSFAIDTEPAWSPDGRHLVFTSDRGGRPQIYRVPMSGGSAVGSPERLTFEGEYNARARYSPDGQRLAMVTGEGNRFRIAVMDLPTGNVRVLTESRLDESPSFSPNGAMIIYATEIRGRGVLEAVAADGRAHQRLGLSKGDVREPAWSPYFR